MQNIASDFVVLAAVLPLGNWQLATATENSFSNWDQTFRTTSFYPRNLCATPGYAQYLVRCYGHLWFLQLKVSRPRPIFRGVRKMSKKTLPAKSLPTAGTKTDAHWTECAISTPLSTRPPLLLEKTRGITQAWLHKLSSNDSIPSSSPFGTRSTRAAPALSKHIWSKDTNFEIEWEVQEKATEYQNTTGWCNLCVAEKLAIIRADKKTLLNKRLELVSKCCHEKRYYLCNFPPPISWSMYLTCLSTNMSPNAVSSEPHISFYYHPKSPVFFVSLARAPHPFVFSLFLPCIFSLVFFLCIFSHWSFSLFFLQSFSQCFPPILTPSHPNQHFPIPSHPYK